MLTLLIILSYLIVGYLVSLLTIYLSSKSRINLNMSIEHFGISLLILIIVWPFILFIAIPYNIAYKMYTKY